MGQGVSARPGAKTRSIVPAKRIPVPPPRVVQVRFTMGLMTGDMSPAAAILDGGMISPVGRKTVQREELPLDTASRESILRGERPQEAPRDPSC
ncbi:hypothetical protein SAMN02799631_04977 [Methylobacterium sp. 174MFSha1.1]|nr:hypothetical protein SAMN02799631_04977 [Methylobacterium sp. 174MFSha1.1]